MVHTYLGEHEIATDLCDPQIHCYSCNRDEPSEGAFIYCYECGHVYRTKRDLRRSYRRCALDVMRRYSPFWLWPLDVVHILFKRAEDIAFCQECAHDF